MLCEYWTLCLVVATIVELDYLLELCMIQTPILFLTLYSSLTEGSMPKVKKIYSWALGLRGILARQGKLSWSFAW